MGDLVHTKINFYQMSAVRFLVAAISRLLINLDSGGGSRDPEEALGAHAQLLNVTDELGGTEEDSDHSENARGKRCDPTDAGVSPVSPFAV